MKIIESIEEMQKYSQQLKRDGKTIACVTSDGYFHDGHMSLVKIAKENADVVVMRTAAVGDLLRFTIEYLSKSDTPATVPITTTSAFSLAIFIKDI